MAYISATTEFQQIIFILKFKHYISDECFSAIKMVGDFSPELPFKGARYSYRSVVLRNVLFLSARRPQIDLRG